ncbi:MAG: acyl-CoA dehydratase activase [Dethiobacteria bacterium]|jgi:predicted CoA-substrate-specific enzyme activase
MGNYAVKVPRIGLDVGTYAVKGVLLNGDEIKRVNVPTAGNPVGAAKKCLEYLLEGIVEGLAQFGLTGANAGLLAGEFDVKPLLEIEALQAGMGYQGLQCNAVLSLGHENMYYMELGTGGTVRFFNRNGQCAAGSGSFWYQQATRMGYNDQELAEIALQADAPVRISGRCAVFAKSDMTHAINEGATQGSVTAGMAKALADMVLTGVAQSRIKDIASLMAVGGVANNKAVMKYIGEYCEECSTELLVPPEHEYLNALGAAVQGQVQLQVDRFSLDDLLSRHYKPERPLPSLSPEKVKYMDPPPGKQNFDLSTVYLGVDCGSVSTKCVLLDGRGAFMGGIYLPTAGRPALQVLELMKEVEQKYGEMLKDVPMVACTTGSGRFLSQKILCAEYAVDEITCQAEGVKYLCGAEGIFSIIEIGGEDSKFLQLKDGVLYDYNMNPVCAAGTGTFLENLAGLLGVQIEGEFSDKAFKAEYAIDLGDTCTLLSQSALVSAASQGLPLTSQLASLAYSSARNYISKTVENRPLEGRIIFTGATARNHALASAFAHECKQEIIVPPYPELSGALGCAVIARSFHNLGLKGEFSFRDLQHLHTFTVSKSKCKAKCDHEHNCTLDVITFSDGSKFLYGDRCGRYSGLDRKAKVSGIPDYLARRKALFEAAAGEPLSSGPRVGIARGGLFFDLYPFWAAFFRELGASVVLSPETSETTFEKGKKELETEMCYPLEVLVGHYQELVEKDLDFIFVPEVVDMEPPPWAEHWPRSFTCSLIQTVKGVVANSLKIEEDKLLYAQLNYKGGQERITAQLEPVARKLLGTGYRENLLQQAVGAGYEAQEAFRRSLMEESKKVMEELKGFRDSVVAVFLGRSYTVCDDFVSKGSLHYARQRGLVAVPQEFLLEHLRGWYEGDIVDAVLDGEREEFDKQLDELFENMDNIYPIQLQKMLSIVFWVNFLNERAEKTGLPLLHLVFQDPFKCGPNAMLRHYLGNLSSYLRLTLDGHTAPAGMITRLEAFQNTCRSRNGFTRLTFYSAQTRYIRDRDWKKILIPEPTHHARVFAAMFQNYGVDAEVLPRSQDKDLTLARRFVNGDECLPLIQNVQDFLDYLFQNGHDSLEETVFFQGWACGPCRYGLYAPTQSLLIDKAGFGKRRICSVKADDVLKRFGINYIVGLFDGITAMDILYKMLHATRPYELVEGTSDALFEKYSEKLLDILRNYRFNIFKLLSGKHISPLETLLAEAAQAFQDVEKSEGKRPLILLGGEFYVRLDDRCNRELIRKIEKEGGEVSLAPTSELFSYTAYINYREACTAFQFNRNLSRYLLKLGYGFVNRLAGRNEHLLEEAASGLLRGHEEPSPQEIMQMARRYVSEHYGGEPPMTIGRACAFARREDVSGIVFVAPFTCMPGSVVESQMGALREALDLPMITIYYDGKENANRDEFIESLVFQAKQRMK